MKKLSLAMMLALFPAVAAADGSLPQFKFQGRAPDQAVPSVPPTEFNPEAQAIARNYGGTLVKNDCGTPCYSFVRDGEIKSIYRDDLESPEAFKSALDKAFKEKGRKIPNDPSLSDDEVKKVAQKYGVTLDQPDGCRWGSPCFNVALGKNRDQLLLPRHATMADLTAKLDEFCKSASCAAR